MNLLNETVENIIAHYASPNYDPRKAHEYYLRNRELKGRRSTKGFNQRQREGWSYVQSRVRETKKGKIDSARVGKKTSIEQVRAQAQALRKDISEKLKAFNKMLTEQYSETSKDITEDAAQTRKSISDKLAADIAAIPEVPKNLPKAQREKLLAERGEKILKLRNEASSSREALNKDVQTDRTSVRSNVQANRQAKSSEVTQRRAQVAGDLKKVVQKYMDAYKNATAKIKSESDATLDREFKNIKSKVR